MPLCSILIYSIYNESRRMPRLSKAFSCRTNPTLSECKSLVEEAFPRKKFVGSTEIFLTSLKDNNRSLEFTLIQSKIRGYLVEMDVAVSHVESASKIEGLVYMPSRSLLLSIYFVAITFALIFVFRPIPFLSLFFLLGFVMATSFIVVTIQNRTNLIDKICNLLSD